MNLLLLDADDFVAPGHVRVGGRRARHVREVLHAGVGATLRVGRIDAEVGTGVITAIDTDGVELDVCLDQPPPPPLPVTLLLALPRPKALGRVLQGVAAQGVKHLVLMHTWRVEKSFWESPLLEPDALRESLILGLEQGGDSVVPRVDLRHRFRPFVEDEVPALAANTRRFVAHPRATQPCPRGLTEATTLAIGPEGGFTDFEVDLLCAHGFEAITIGTRPLRVEQAVPALLGRLF